MSPNVTRELAIIPVEAGGGRYSTSGLQTRRPRVYAGHFAPEGARPRTALILIHPISNFMDHYLLEPLARAGFGALGLTTRFVNNETVFISELAVLDLAAGVRFLRERGYENVVLVGNSGGGGLVSLYQNQAECPTITSTPAGDPPDLTRADLPAADAIITVAAHPGRPRVLTDYLDPSVLREDDPLAVDPELDMFDPANGPPYSAEFLARYRQAQVERNHRITDWARARLEELGRLDSGATDQAFLVFRTNADPRMLDVGIDPSDRQPGCEWGDPRALNLAPLAIGRFSTLRSWLSHFGLKTSNMQGPIQLATVRVPVLVINYTADRGAWTSYARAYYEAVGHDDKAYADIPGASHYPNDHPEHLQAIVRTMGGWLAEHGLA